MRRGIFFDLDGTLADTAPDLIAAINLLRWQRGMEALSLDELKPFVSSGAQGLIGAALAIGPYHQEYEGLRCQFLDNYERCLFKSTQLFPGVKALLSNLDQLGYIWGIVTNKFKRYALPLVQNLQLNPHIVVCGDTTAHIKPHPEPLLHAISFLGLISDRCIYVGDDPCDIQAGQAAGTLTIGVTYGYGNKNSLMMCGADFLIDTPATILEILS